MASGQFLLPLALCLILFFTSWQVIPNVLGSQIVQRSEGCGPHPLVALVAASRPYGSGTTPTLSELLRTVKANPEVWSTMSGLLRRYDDCIRAGDGLHYKRQDTSFLKSLPIKFISKETGQEVSSAQDDASQFMALF